MLSPATQPWTFSETKQLPTFPAICLPRAWFKSQLNRKNLTIPALHVQSTDGPQSSGSRFCFWNLPNGVWNFSHCLHPQAPNEKKCDTILAGILYGHIVSAVCLVHPFCSPRSRRFLITRPSRFFLFLPDSEYKYVDEGCVIVETCVSLMNYRQEMA